MEEVFKALEYLYDSNFENSHQEYDLIYDALNELKTIKESNPSEALSRIEECWYDDPYTDREDNLTYEDDIDTIKQALTTKSKKEQAFDIIKEKNVNIGIVTVVGSLEQYNQTYVYDNMLNVKWCLTEEEFDLLKEVLK